MLTPPMPSKPAASPPTLAMRTPLVAQIYHFETPIAIYWTAARGESEEWLLKLAERVHPQGMRLFVADPAKTQGMLERFDLGEDDVPALAIYEHPFGETGHKHSYRDASDERTVSAAIDEFLKNRDEL